MHDDDQIEEFMSELYDKFYPQVMEGLEQMRAGEVHAGIEALSRPLHTIKGVTGFLGGFETASTFTHKVESFLKKIQSGDVELDDAVSSAAITAVNMVFQVIEQIRDTGGGPQDEMEGVLERIRSLSEPRAVQEETGKDGVRLTSGSGVVTAAIAMPRVHLPEQCRVLQDVLERQEAGVPLVLDFSGVRSVGSGLWEMLEAYAGRFPIHVAGMCPYVRGTFHGWGYGALFTEHEHAAAVAGDAASSGISPAGTGSGGQA